MKSSYKILLSSFILSILFALILLKKEVPFNEIIFYFIGFFGVVASFIYFSYGSFLMIKKLYFSNYKLKK